MKSSHILLLLLTVSQIQSEDVKPEALSGNEIKRELTQESGLAEGSSSPSVAMGTTTTRRKRRRKIPVEVVKDGEIEKRASDGSPALNEVTPPEAKDKTKREVVAEVVPEVKDESKREVVPEVAPIAVIPEQASTSDVKRDADTGQKPESVASPEMNKLIEKIYEEEQDMKKLMETIVREEKQMEKMLDKITKLEARVEAQTEKKHNRHHSRHWD